MKVIIDKYGIAHVTSDQSYVRVKNGIALDKEEEIGNTDTED